MKGLITNFDYRENFWEVNPSFTSVKLYEDLYNSDTTKNKKYSSQIMWAIAFYVDVNDNNPWRNIDSLEKEDLIKEDILKDKKFNFESIKPHIKIYEDLVLSPAEKKLYNFYLKLEERTNFINNTKYDLDNADQLDKMLANTKKLYDLYFEIRKEFEADDKGGNVKGDRKESASERKLL
jgi:phospholipase C